MILKAFSARASNRSIWIFPLLFVVLAFIKAPILFRDPRFWAEEGTAFFQQFLTKSFIESIFTTYIGSYLFLTNLSTFLATLVPLKHAPAVTTYFALAIHSIVAVQIGLFAKEHKMPIGIGLLLIVAWAFLPATYEVWLTATNIQWVTGVSMLLVLAMPGPALDRARSIYLTWSIICALSGVPATILAPLFVGRFILEKNKSALWIGLTLGAGAILQIAVIANSVVTGRSFSRSILSLLRPIALQTTLVSFLGPAATEDIAKHVRSAPLASAMTYLTLIIGGGLAAMAFVAPWKSPGRLIAIYILLAAILVSVVQVFGSLGDPAGMISSMAGGRYFLFGQVALCLILALGTASSNIHLKRLAAILLLTICIVQVEQKMGKPALFSPILTGPSWRQQVKRCQPDQPCRIEIWPPGWHLDVKP